MPSAEQPLEVVIGPNPGPQSKAFASTATITVYGGQAGGGKTWLTMLRFAVHADQYPGYAAIIFRREMPMVTQGGGLWEESMGLYPIWGAKPNTANFSWRFPRRSLIQFRGLQHEKDVLNYQGAQLAEFCLEEATHFEESQFWYLFSRLRTKCGMKARCMLTCNPDPDSWVRKLIDWWIGPDGLSIPERAGAKRYFLRDGDTFLWGDSASEVRALAPHLTQEPISIRFIPAALSDNPQGDPNYRDKLEALPRIERERLLGGNWNVRPVAGSYFRRSYFEIINVLPSQVKRKVRAWDLAGTEPSATNKDPDWTVGVLLLELHDGRYVVDHVERIRTTPGKVDAALMAIAAQDGLSTIQAFWQDPAQAGKAQRDYIVKLLRGFRVRFVVASEDKETYAGPVSSDAENGKILIRAGAWNEPFLSVLEGFPVGKKKDDVDALSRAHIELTRGGQDFQRTHIPGY
jgi:predicted phage terminase large subunit-like protein